MSVYIKGMEMPKNCAECSFNMEVCKRGYAYLLEHPELYEKRSDDCPIVEVKIPHGRLGDLDALIHEYYRAPTYPNLCKVINNAPTVLEAEE